MSRFDEDIANDTIILWNIWAIPTFILSSSAIIFGFIIFDFHKAIFVSIFCCVIVSACVSVRGYVNDKIQFAEKIRYRDHLIQILALSDGKDFDYDAALWRVDEMIAGKTAYSFMNTFMFCMRFIIYSVVHVMICYAAVWSLGIERIRVYLGVDL